MESEWQRRRILIWGKTRPELSKKYREIVCTGGVFEDTRQLVRIYPVPLRYMDDEKIFKKYQWIEAFVKKSSSDYRPESYKIRYDGIETFETIPTKSGNWDDRAEWVMNDDNIFPSVEILQEKQRRDHTSLGLVKPAKILDIRSVRYDQGDRDRFWSHYQDAIRQMELPFDAESGHEIKPLTPPDYRFKIRFCCNGTDCQREHNFSVLDWETDALYFHLRKRGDAPHIAARKVVDKLQEICGPEKDIYFFLGNISSHPQVFSIVGFWWPKKHGPKQLRLGV